MRTVGNTTTFDHVTHSTPTETIQEPRAIFLVEFDGAWEIWFSQKLRPSDAEIDKCKKELTEYYQRDWARTGRVLPVMYIKHNFYDSISCI